MVDTFYLHLEFTSINGWSINLPFLCTKCGNCCTLEDFLTAGKINAKPEEYPETHVQVNTLFEKLGKMWEADESKYDAYIMHNPCPFLVKNSCAIYEIRPDGCQQFPKTAFGMQTTDCEPLTRFKKQRAALKRGRRCKETYRKTGIAKGTVADKQIKPAKFTQTQYRTCVVKLRQAGITDDELTLFNNFNEQNKS